MLIIALVLAVIGLAALVTAVVTSNALIAWVCIGASLVGVILLIVDAVRDRSRPARADGDVDDDAGDSTDYPDDRDQHGDQFDADYPDDAVAEPAAGEPGPDSHPDDPDADTRAVPFDERHEDRPTS